MVEFTGERVIPGHVDADLWNEHYSRYLFATRLSRFRRVLDAGAGAGYGSQLLSQNAKSVVALDFAADALALVPVPDRVQATAAQLPFGPNSFDLVVAFEVVEHISDWAEFLRETRRVLAPGGQLIISTPNTKYYADTRAESGPNPFHVHEFTFDEFREALHEVFPHVALFIQNHAAGIVFQPVAHSTNVDARMDDAPLEPDRAHFYVAVCAASPQTGGPTFVYLPSSANVLKEREEHIARLQDELVTKDTWLSEARTEHAALVEQHRHLQAELTRSNQWAGETEQRWKASQQRVSEMQSELVAEQQRGQEVVEGYEQQMVKLQASCDEALAWARDNEDRLTAAHAAITAELQAKVAELGAVVQLLDAAEQTVIDRTNWARQLEQTALQLEEQLASVRTSRWVKLGRSLGLGPINHNP